MSRKLFDLHGKNVLLTGASKGMGLSMAQGLVNHGANVVISSRKLDQCQKAADAINESLGQKKLLHIHAMHQAKKNCKNWWNFQ